MKVKENVKLKKNSGEKKQEEIIMIHRSKLVDFDETPYKVFIDKSMDELVESIKENGVLTPIIVRKKDKGKYDIIIP